MSPAEKDLREAPEDEKQRASPPAVRALVTGGTGFIGANLVAGLAEQGITACVLRRPTSSLEALQGLTYETAIGDVLGEVDALAAAMEGCHWVFHVAAVADYWRQSTDYLYRVNVEGTRRVLEAARQAGVQRFVFTSSQSALGLPQLGEAVVHDEGNTFNISPAQFPYGHSKHLAEEEVRRAVAEGLEAVIVNPTVVLGPRDVNQNSGSIVVEAARGWARFVPPGGANFVHVSDVVAGHIEAARRGRVGERYILGAHNLKHAEAVPIVFRIVGRRPPRLKIPQWLLPPAAGAVRAARAVIGRRLPFDENQVRLMGAEIYADCSKARRELDLPQTPFPVAVQDAYNWYNKHGYLG